MRAASEAYVTGYSESERQRLAPRTRAYVGAICGGFASWLWFLEWLGIAWNVYGLVGSLVMAALSLHSRVSREIARVRMRRSGRGPAHES